MREYQIKLESIESVKQFVHLISHYDYAVELSRKHYRVNAKSIMGVLSLGIGDSLTLLVHTTDTEELELNLQPFLI